MKTIISFCFLIFSISLQAAGPKWVINKDHSEVLFKVPYMQVSELTGRFNDYRADIELNEKTLEPMTLTVFIMASSIDTGNKLRDGHLRGSDFFESGKYPEIVFRSKNITKLKAEHFRATGYLTIKSVTRGVAIDFTMTPSVKDTWGHENRFVRFSSEINRKDFNINWNKTLDDKKFLVGDKINFWGVFQIQPQKDKTPQSKHMIPDTEYIRDRESEIRKNKEESNFSKRLRKLINGQ